MSAFVMKARTLIILSTLLFYTEHWIIINTLANLILQVHLAIARFFFLLFRCLRIIVPFQSFCLWFLALWIPTFFHTFHSGRMRAGIDIVPVPLSTPEPSPVAPAGITPRESSRRAASIDISNPPESNAEPSSGTVYDGASPLIITALASPCWNLRSMSWLCKCTTDKVKTADILSRDLQQRWE